MKILKILSLCLMTAGLITACEDELDPQIPDNAVSPKLTAPTEGGTYVLQKADEAANFQTFTWSAADLKINAVVSYNLEVTSSTDAAFSNKKVISTNIASPFSITVGDFNKGLLAAGFEDGNEHKIKVRISAANVLGTQAIDMTVTPYFDAEPWSVIGSAVGGWNPENDRFMSFDKESNTYSLKLDMKPGEFKFRASKKDKDPWKYNLGINAGKIIDNGANIALKDGGDNIGVSGGNYTVTLDLVKQEFSIVQNSAADFTIWTDVVLDAVGTGVSIDTEGASADASSWGWGNVKIADNDGKPAASAAVYTWKWTGITLEAAEGFKLRTLNGVASPVNGMSFDVGFAALDVDASSSKVVDAGGNLSVSEKGRYTIVLTIDATNGDAKKIVITEYFEYPPQLYVIGSAVNGWSWDDNNDLPMIPAHSHPELFWRVLYLEGGEGMKFSAERNWNNTFGAVSESATGENGVFEIGKENLTVPAPGYYTVVVNLKDKTIELATPTIYGIGGAFGGWDGATPGNIFTVDNTAKTISFASVPANGTLRMHAAASTLNCDWWQAEFNIIDGNIVYRGNGGDQTGIPDVVAGQTVSLNFQTMKGEVKN